MNDTLFEVMNILAWSLLLLPTWLAFLIYKDHRKNKKEKADVEVK